MRAESASQHPDSLMLAVYAMDEPWRRRFLVLVAKLATQWAWENEEPTRDEVRAWLNAQPELRKYLRLLLRQW